LCVWVPVQYSFPDTLDLFVFQSHANDSTAKKWGCILIYDKKCMALAG
jgi:hypothetical protein